MFFTHHNFNIKTVCFDENSKLISIGEFSFSDSFIEDIEIPKTVKIIERNAFSYYTELKKFKIPYNSQLTIIDKFALNETSIVSITIPFHVKKLVNVLFGNVET